MGGRSVLQRIQQMARQFQHVPNMVQDICEAIDQQSRLLDASTSLTQQEKQRRARIGSKQHWACAKCKHQLDNQFQVLNIRENQVAICSRCIQQSLAGQC